MEQRQCKKPKIKPSFAALPPAQIAVNIKNKSMKTSTPNILMHRWNAVVLAVSLAAFTGCAQVQPPKATPPPVALVSASPSVSGMPSAATLQRVVDEAYARFKGDVSGKNADYIPYLASVPSNLFAVVIVTADGQVFSAGDINYAFSIQSCSKVFTMCQVMQESGEDAVFKWCHGRSEIIASASFPRERGEDSPRSRGRLAAAETSRTPPDARRAGSLPPSPSG